VPGRLNRRLPAFCLIAFPELASYEQSGSFVAPERSGAGVAKPDLMARFGIGIGIGIDDQSLTPLDIEALDPAIRNMYNISVQERPEVIMATVTTYTNARATLAALCDQVSSTREPVIIRRRNAADVALVSADELESLLETAHLMRSPKNAERLLAAIARAKSNELKPSTIEDLRKELGLGQEAE
jgi:antitoxin YefM